MNKKMYRGVVVIFILVSAIILAVCVANNKKEKNIEIVKSGIEKNHGLSYQSIEVNVNQDGTIDNSIFNAEDIVPNKDTLINNLKDKGFDIKITNTVFTSNIHAEQIYASYKDAFCTITYGLDQDEADEIFLLYEKEYTENQYYIMVKNGVFVYCVSDNDTFTKAGFKGLANSGIQYINHDNY